MYSMYLLMLSLICFSSGNDQSNCYMKVFLSNGSESWCFDEECSINHLDIVWLENEDCRTNYLSLKYSSYSKYSNLLLSQGRLSSFFREGRPNIERLLQIQFLSPLENNSPFQFDQLHLLTNDKSNIDTYEFLFDGNLSANNSIIFIDQQFLMSNEQEFIDTFRFIFNCTTSQRVEWELVKSISSFPESPCPQQIQFLMKNSPQNENCLNFNVFIRILLFIDISLLLIIGLFLWKFYSDHRYKEQFRSTSRTELIEIIEKF